ncbi:anti-sigma factor antagonist [Desulfonatronospira sp.]|uniref:anti-sigma factor antagonist n=1 Tax=Desulfonatronospira sp. TaxID=1962951 RepID=UPI0025BE953B|nr:anti-sigma factor antagonist [Desulfonatronospira sp.]
MQVSVTCEKDIFILSLEGRLDHKGASDLEDALTALPGEPSHLILDMQGVDYLSSMGIRSLIAWEKILKKRSGAIILCGLPPGGAQILRVAGLLDLFRTAGNLDTALGLVSGATRPQAGESFVSNAVFYSIVHHPDHVSWLDCWGCEVSKDRSLLPISLEELGISFGLSGLGGTAQDAETALGAFVATGEAVAVVPADSRFHPDWMLGHAPSESVLFVRRALSLTGQPACTVDVAPDASSKEPFFLQTALEDIFARLQDTSAGPVSWAGFVAAGRGVDISGRFYRDVQEMDRDVPAGKCSFTDCRIFAAGLLHVGAGEGTGREEAFSRDVLSRFLPGADLSEKFASRRISWAANALVFDSLAVDEITAPDEINHLISLDTLGSVCRLEPDSRCASLRLWVYLPKAVRTGEEKRLRIETRACKPLSHAGEIVARRIYNDSARMVLEPLAGGFSADTYRVHSYDAQGRELLPTVLKIGGKDWIDREVYAYHQHVQKFILNNSTTILGTAEHGDTAGLRYNFLGITGAGCRLEMLRDLYAGLPEQDLQSIIYRVFTSILKPWYGQPRWDILRPYMDHDPRRLFMNICTDAESFLGISSSRQTLACPALGRDLPNPYNFLEHGYTRRAGQTMRWYTSIIHGDLNLANILMDDNDNLYVIDFSETRQGNIVSDLARLEVIACLGMSRIKDETDLRRVVHFAQALAQNETIDHTPDYDCSQDDPLLGKAYSLVRVLRSLAGRMTIFEHDPVPYYLAMLEWILPMVSYRDITVIRKQAAAYWAAILAERIMDLEKQPD